MALKRIISILLFLIITLSLSAQDKLVYVASIEGDIDLGLAPFVRRVISDAEKAGADAIIFRINTFGGRVDAATQIKDAILESKVLTIGFVDKRAISAGSLIALSCQKVAMVPGSSMGATTVVDQTGEKQAEKYQSYMRSEMRSTAERNKRRTDVAEAMVDERVVIEGLVDSTQLVTLTAEEAFKYGMADTVVSSIQELLKAFDLEGAVIVDEETNWAEEVVRFLNNPIISSLLIMVGLIGLYTEIKSPGWGLPGTLGLSALVLFFGSAYILQLATIIEILMFIGGVILLLVEIFVIPGFGIAGFSGIILMLAALFLSLMSGVPYFDMDMISSALLQLTASIVLAIIGMITLARFLPKFKSFNRLILNDEEKAVEGYMSNPDFKTLVGAEGITLTPLRLSGTASIDGKRVDVVSDGDYINKGVKVKVIFTEGMRVVVKEIE